MKVTLIDGTGMGTLDPARYAAHILIYTKSTRLQMSPGLLYEVKQKTDDEIRQELKIMADTNPGSWEFVHFTFLIQGVSRAFTHQLVRTRTASYAQQTMRTVPMEGWTYETGPSVQNNERYKSIMDIIADNYQKLIKEGARVEDARGILPTNIHTNINMSINMRNFINFSRKRASIRVQDEHTKVVDAMVREIEAVYPWFHIFYKNDEMQAMRELQNIIMESKLTHEEKVIIWKKIDLLKKEV